MIFKLDVNCREEEGEIIIPAETGFFNVGDYAKTYVVKRVEKWGKMSKPSEHFISRHFLTAVNQGGRTEKAEKSRHFSILMKTAKSLKNSRNFSF